MFSFCYDMLPSRKKNLNFKILLNDHEIMCQKENAKSISKIIWTKLSSSKKKEDEVQTFSFEISDFKNSFICSESDYELFNKIFNSIPIRINSTNKEVLNILANNFEIEELSSLIKLYEEFEIQVTNDEKLQILKDLTNQIIDINEDNFDSVLNLFSATYKKHEDIVNIELIYNIFITACTIRPIKTEMLIKLLKKFEDITNGGQFQYFKKIVIQDLSENIISKEIRFVVTHLYDIKEITSEEITSVLKLQDRLVLYDIKEDKKMKFNFLFLEPLKQNESHYTPEQIVEYKRTCMCPLKIYQIILKDDLKSFIEIITQDGSEMKFNDSIFLLDYERYSDITKIENYFELAAFFGSENIFNYILMNIDATQAFQKFRITSAIIGGNINIIHKCLEYINIQNSMKACIRMAIKYNHIEIFEWIFENYDVSSLFNQQNYFDNYNEENLFDDALKYNNYDVISYLLLEGYNYESLFALSLFYNHFYLAEFALKLPYKFQKVPKKMKAKNFDPLFYEYHNEPPLFLAIYKNKLNFVKEIIKSDNFDPDVEFESSGPLVFAAINDKIDIVKYLVEDKRFTFDKKSNSNDQIDIFEYALGHDLTEITEFLLTQKNVLKFGKKTRNIMLFINDLILQICFYNQNKHYSGSFPMIDFIEKFANFYYKKSENKIVNDIKKEIIMKNKEMFTCVSALICNEKDFEQFLDDYEIDINVIEPKTVFLIIFLK